MGGREGGTEGRREGGREGREGGITVAKYETEKVGPQDGGVGSL